MKRIVIGFSLPQNRVFPIASYLIRLYEGTHFSHCYLKIQPIGSNSHLIYESVGSGTRFISEDTWKLKAKTVDEFEIIVSDEIHAEILEFCYKNAGESYGFMQNVGVVVARVLKLPKNPFNKDKNCSETTARILNIIKKVFDTDLNLVTPKDIYEALLENKIPGQEFRV